MSYTLRNKDELPAFIDSLVSEYIDLWIPNDKREAKHIIGYEAYQHIVRLGLEQEYGDMFSLMVSKGVLPLIQVNSTSSGHNRYALKV